MHEVVLFALGNGLRPQVVKKSVGMTDYSWNFVLGFWVFFSGTPFRPFWVCEGRPNNALIGIHYRHREYQPFRP